MTPRDEAVYALRAAAVNVAHNFTVHHQCLFESVSRPHKLGSRPECELCALHNAIARLDEVTP